MVQANSALATESEVIHSRSGSANDDIVCVEDAQHEKSAVVGALEDKGSLKRKRENDSNM